MELIKRRMPTDQRALYIGVILVWLSSLLFLLFSGGKLGVVMAIITTIITSYLLLLARWSGIKNISGVRETEHLAQHRLETGDSFTSKTSYKIPGFWPIPYVLVKDHLIHHQFGEQIYESSFVPNFYRVGDIEYKIDNLRRGSYRFGNTECSTGDLLNLFEHKSNLQLPYDFKVYPRTIAIKEWPYVSTFKKAIRNSSASRFQKETNDIDGVREYIHGDRLSRIHWNASSKTGTLKSKEFVRESVPKIILVMDQYRSAYKDNEQFELVVSTVASVIRYLSKYQLPIGLLSPGKKITYFEPKHEATYSKQLEEHLLYVNKDGQMNIQTALLSKTLNKLQGSLVVVVTPEANDELSHRLSYLRKSNLHPCHIWVSNEENEFTKSWKLHLQSEQINVYQVGKLEELPLALRGERQ